MEEDSIRDNAKHVFGGMLIPGRPDLQGDNWQMGEVTAMAARRLKRYMRSGESGMRTYDPISDHVRQRKDNLRKRDKAYNKFYFPVMKDAEFERMHKLPGMKTYNLKESTGGSTSRIPWHFYGKRYADELWKTVPHGHKDERKPDY